MCSGRPGKHDQAVPGRVPQNAAYAQYKSPAEFWAELKRRKVIDDED